MFRNLLYSMYASKCNLVDHNYIFPILFSRQFGMKSNKNDPHIKYNYGKEMFYPKYGNSHYEALEYDRKLSSKDPDPNKSKIIKLKESDTDLLHLLPKNDN